MDNTFSKLFFAENSEKKNPLKNKKGNGGG